MITLILQNRERLAQHLQAWEEEEIFEIGRRLVPPKVRNRLARAWHLLAIFYLLLLYGVWALQVKGGFIFLLRATLSTLVVILIIRLVFRFLRNNFV